MKKNCNNCKHLEWVCDGGDGMGHFPNSGWDCNKRYEDMHQKGRGDELLGNLERDEYRDRAKRCCELKLHC